MKKALTFFSIFLLTIFFLKTSSSMAVDSPDSIANCPGDRVVNITYIVENDVVARTPRLGNNGVWATNRYIERLQVWRAYPSMDIFCAKVEDKGIFTTLTGESPQGTDPNIAAGIDGTLQGGYRTTYFLGNLNLNSDFPRFGNLGVIDYQCSTADPGDHSSCINYWRWQDIYFMNFRLLSPFHGAYDWFGWRYDTELNGIWFHICSGRGAICPGNKGDITDN